MIDDGDFNHALPSLMKNASLSSHYT